MCIYTHTCVYIYIYIYIYDVYTYPYICDVPISVQFSPYFVVIQSWLPRQVSAVQSRVSPAGLLRHCLYVYICRYVCELRHCLYVHVCMYVCLCTYIHTKRTKRNRRYACMCICMYVCMYQLYKVA